MLHAQTSRLAASWPSDGRKANPIDGPTVAAQSADEPTAADADATGPAPASGVRPCGATAKPRAAQWSTRKHKTDRMSLYFEPRKVRDIMVIDI